jgi:hypothetical protein
LGHDFDSSFRRPIREQLGTRRFTDGFRGLGILDDFRPQRIFHHPSKLTEAHHCQTQTRAHALLEIIRVGITSLQVIDSDPGAFNFELLNWGLSDSGRFDLAFEELGNSGLWERRRVFAVKIIKRRGAWV